MSASRPTEQPTEPPALTGVTMHELLAACAAAAVVSRPPCAEGARGTARPATTAPQSTDDMARQLPRSA
ncbi:hypothetical protein [Streptomyces sp. NPDC020362]|uniref:hypothetical protein n=1 Tax=unclassified Streptomyces TaxID=2593676 RepID=UPI0033ECEE67